VSKVEVIASGFDVYVKNFTMLADAKRRLGLTEDLGLESQLRKSVHEIESTLKDYSGAGLNSAMLTMLRHEKDFMLRRDPKYGESMRHAATEFAGLLAKSEIPAATKTDLSTKLAAYQRDFAAWMEGMNAVIAGQKAVSEAFTRIEPAIEDINATIARTALDAARLPPRRATIRAPHRNRHRPGDARCRHAGVFHRARRVEADRAMTLAMRELAGGKLDLEIPGVGRHDEIVRWARRSRCSR